jgi:sugar phosphate isomerase/epimerase
VHLRACIDASAALGAPPVGTFIGRDAARSVAENLREAERVFPPLVDYAGERGVTLMIENCVMEGWHPDGHPGNLAYSPELWEWMFGLGLKLNFDPSHLLWLGIDPVAALRPYVANVAHAHAKDAETFPEQRNRYGFFGRVSTRESDPWDMGWWRYRIPGLGEVDFRRYVDALYEGGFDGVLSVEHEDPVWGGSPERVEQGLQIAQRTLRDLVVG